MTETPINERAAAHAEHCGCSLPRCEFIEGWDAAFRAILRPMPDPDTFEERRAEFAYWLDSLHGEYVTEGGCDFKPWQYGWRPGDAPHPNRALIDPIIQKAMAAL